ncbi:MAG: AAA family ATPase [Desulfovibrio sp.]|nr:AAA family ATPase [Desulfovibrio sp.]MBI4961333.1 AAA family ATPase [Desulfovibrio sp.]
MQVDGVKFKNYRCFKNEWAGFDDFFPINIVIGRNNSGKSCLLDLINFIVSGEDCKKPPTCLFSYKIELSEEELKNRFRDHVSGGELRGNHWHSHGVHLVGCELYFEKDSAGNIANIVCDKISNGADANDISARINFIKNILDAKRHKFHNKKILKVAAERDIVVESATSDMTLTMNGLGATNVIHNCINSSKLPRDIIQKELLDSLNLIMGKDANFTEIQVQFDENNKWEVYLGEEGKGLIALSRSGSGLKTVILVLLNTIVIPKILKKNPSDCVYIFEELENNMHPALQRRLIDYIEWFCCSNNCFSFLTTHSSVALDKFYTSKNAQLIRVEHDGESAKTYCLKEHFDGLGVIKELGIRASDLLQANGIVWVEGPSDAIYINKWIEIVSEGRLQEGRDYQCVFYGGSLLSHFECVSPDESNELINLITVNPNSIIICDGDRTAKTGSGSRVKRRVSRIIKEMHGNRYGYVWVTDAKEVESYIPVEVLKIIWKKSSLLQIDQFEPFWRIPTENNPDVGYFQKHCPTKTVNKVGLARAVVDNLNYDNLSRVFDWKLNMDKIHAIIKSWNSN